MSTKGEGPVVPTNVASQSQQGDVVYRLVTHLKAINNCECQSLGSLN